MSEYPTDIYIADLSPEDGFTVRGVRSGDLLGQGAAGIGDINGDGIDDFMVGALFADVNGGDSGAAYVVFGTTAGFPTVLDLLSLDGTNGFRVAGPGGSASGYAGLGADVNGDGFIDLIVSAPNMGPASRGGAYIIYGHEGPFAASINLSTPVEGVSSRILNHNSSELMGLATSSVGDINGDGIEDFALATDRANHGIGSNAGAAYVIFGNADGLPVDFSLSQINGTNGFEITGQLAGWQLGRSIASAGDLNGDGTDDLVIGAPGYDNSGNDNAGAAFVIYGRSTFGAAVNVGALDGTTGFRISGESVDSRLGYSVSAAGDFDGDGHADLILGGRGKAFLVFGAATGPTEINFSTGAGAHWVMRLDYPASTSLLTVDGGFDFNADGRSDILVGGAGIDNNRGALYMVFGGAHDAALRLNEAAAANGVTIHGAFTSTSFTDTISELGDINGDGVEDFFIGSKGDDVNGTDAGAGYIIYGRPVVYDLVGLASDDQLSGGFGSDSLSGMGGMDVLRGLGGDDMLDGGTGNDYLYGGAGADDLVGGDGGDSLFGDDGDDLLVGQAGADKQFGDLGQDTLDGGDGNDRLDGGAQADSLIGGDGNDYLDGGAGADAMTGGLANDIFLVDDLGDTTIELEDEGYDIVRADIGWTLGDNIEALQLQGSADIDGVGNALANNIQGNSGGNRLEGGAGADTINGNDGDDIIVGGVTGDHLRGGAGADTFVVAHAFGPTLETDIIYDFDTGQGDTIDLSAIDTNLSLDGDQGFVLVGSFTKAAGQMTLTYAAGQTTLRLDLNGDGRVDYQMKINGDVTHDSGGWAL